MKVGITYEITRTYYEEYEVTDCEYKEICEGELPEWVAEDLEYHIEELDGNRDDDWSAVNLETGKTIQDWR